MRITVSAQADFFRFEHYMKFERLLAAMAAGCMSVKAVNPEEKIDVQINSVLNYHSAGQYVYDPSYNVSPFGHANPSRSLVTLEIDHINEQADGDNEQLVCKAAVALVAAVYDTWQAQNCWSKMHGSSKEQTGWAEGIIPSALVKLTLSTVEAFALSEISAAQMVRELRPMLMDELETSLVHKTGAAQHLHAGET